MDWRGSEVETPASRSQTSSFSCLHLRTLARAQHLPSARAQVFPFNESLALSHSLLPYLRLVSTFSVTANIPQTIVLTLIPALEPTTARLATGPSTPRSCSPRVTNGHHPARSDGLGSLPILPDHRAALYMAGQLLQSPFPFSNSVMCQAPWGTVVSMSTDGRCGAILL